MADPRHIDLNSDVGEGFGAWPGGPDDALMPMLTSVNIACGFHAGDPLIMQRTCALAHQHGCTIGAQVSYPDLAGFGRRFMEMQPAELTAAVVYHRDVAERSCCDLRPTRYGRATAAATTRIHTASSGD